MSKTDVAVLQALDDAKLDKRAQKALDTLNDALDDLKLDKRTRRAAQQIQAAIVAAKLDKKAGKAIHDAKLDKRGKQIGNTLSDTLDDFHLQKRLATVNDAISDLRLDKRTHHIADSVQKSLKDVKFDAKTAAVATATVGSVASWKLDKKAGDLADSTASALKDAKLDKKAAHLVHDVRHDSSVANTVGDIAANVTKTVSDAVKDFELDKKVAAAGTAIAALELDKKAADFVDTASARIKDLELDKKAGDFADSATSTVKDLKLDKKASDFVDTASAKFKDLELDKRAATVADNTVSAFKDAKLDKKAGDFADSATSTVAGWKLADKAGGLADSATSTVKDLRLDKKASDFADSATSTVKDWKLGDKANNAVAAVQKVDLTKAQDVPGIVGDRVRSFQLDKKAADFSDIAGETVKGALPGAKLERATRAFATENGIKPDDTFQIAQVRDTLKDLGFQDRFNALADSFGAGLDTRRFGNKGDAVIKTAQKQIRSADILSDPTDVQKAVATALTAMGVKAGRDKIANAAKQAVADEQAMMRKQYKEYRKDWAEQVTLDLRGIRFEQPKRIKQKNEGGGLPWRTIFLLAATTGGIAVNNARINANVPPLESKLDGQAHYHKSRQGVIFYKTAGEGDATPIVLIHGIGAGASSYEWRKNFTQLAADRPVYAYDLLGFGNSERPSFHYTPEVYIKQLTEFIDEVVGKPAIVVAASLAGAYAVQVAYRRPELIERLVLVNATGINKSAGQTGPGIFFQWFEAILRAPVYGTALYNGIASHGGIESFLKTQLYNDPSQVTPDQIEQYWVAAHQEGSKYAPAAFLSGNLNAQIDQTFAKLTQPSLLVWGANSTITPVKEAETLKAANPRARLEVIPNTKLGVNEEQAERFNELVRGFVTEQVEPTTKVTDGSTSVGFVHKGIAADEEGFGAADSGTNMVTPSSSTLGKATDTPTVSSSAAASAASPTTGNSATTRTTFSNTDSNRTENAGAPRNTGVKEADNSSPLDDRKIDSASLDPKPTSQGTRAAIASEPSLAQPAPSAAKPVSLDPGGALVGTDDKNPALTTSTDDMQKLEADKQQHTGSQALSHEGGQLEGRTGDTALG